MKFNTAGQVIGVQAINAADGLGFAGTLSGVVSIDGGAQVALLGTGPTLVGSGYYKYLPTQLETSGNHLAFTFNSNGVIPTTVQVYTTLFDPAVNKVTLDNTAHGGVAATLALKNIDVIATDADQSAVTFIGKGAGNGFECFSEVSNAAAVGYGMLCASWGTGAGFSAAGLGNGDGVYFGALGTGSGMSVVGKANFGSDIDIAGDINLTGAAAFVEAETTDALTAYDAATSTNITDAKDAIIASGTDAWTTATGFNTVVPPSVAQFNERTLPSGEYFNSAVDKVFLGNGTHGGNSATLQLESADITDYLFVGQLEAVVNAVNWNTYWDEEVTRLCSGVLSSYGPSTPTDVNNARDSIIASGEANWSTSNGVDLSAEASGYIQSRTLPSGDYFNSTVDKVFLGDGVHGGTSATLTLEHARIVATGVNRAGMYVQGNGLGYGIHATGVAGLGLEGSFHGLWATGTLNDIFADINGSITSVTNGVNLSTAASGYIQSRTLPSGDYFNPSADTVAHVTLVDTTTTNSDMRGTDGANTVVPDAAGTAATEAEVIAAVLTGTNTVITSGNTYWVTGPGGSSPSEADIYNYFTSGTNENAFKADVSNLPTLSQFNDRTLASGDYFNPTVDTVTLANGPHGGTSATLTLERVRVVATGTNIDGVYIQGKGNGNGMLVVGGDSGDGFVGYAGTGGQYGIVGANAGGSNGAGILAIASGPSSHGFSCVAINTGSAGIKAVGVDNDILADITGSITSVTNGVYLSTTASGYIETTINNARDTIIDSGNTYWTTGSGSGTAPTEAEMYTYFTSASREVAFQADISSLSSQLSGVYENTQPLASGTADSGTTTTLVDEARNESDTDYWTGCAIQFTSGSIVGQVRVITGFTPGSPATITFSPATTQAVSTNTYKILPGVDSIFDTSSAEVIYNLFTTGSNEDVFKADISSLPTLSQLNSRTLPSGDYFNPNTDTIASVTTAKNDIISSGNTYWATPTDGSLEVTLASGVSHGGSTATLDLKKINVIATDQYADAVYIKGNAAGINVTGAIGISNVGSLYGVFVDGGLNDIYGNIQGSVTSVTNGVNLGTAASGYIQSRTLPSGMYGLDSSINDAKNTIIDSGNTYWAGSGGPSSVTEASIYEYFTSGTRPDPFKGTGSDSSGSGAWPIIVTINDGSNPLQNATVRYSEGANSFVSNTDSSGNCTFNLDSASYVVSIYKGGYSFSGDTHAVSNSGSITYSMSAITITEPASPSLSAYVVKCISKEGLPESGITVSANMTHVPFGEQGMAYDKGPQTDISDANGLAVLNLVRNATYKISRGVGLNPKRVTIPDTPTSSGLSLLE